MEESAFIEEWNSETPYIEAHSSGSTGNPKKIRLSKHDMLLSARATNDFFGINKHSILVCPMDYRFIGAKMMAVRSLISGAKLVSIPPSNHFDFDCRADLLAVVPSQVDCILKNEKLLRLTRNLIIGGAPLDDERRAALINAGIRAYITYGMTETASHVALSALDSDVFTALPGITFSLDNRSCLIINMPERDVNRVVTNDIALLVDSQHFRWLGRFDNVINSGGLKIHPEQIEPVVKNVLKELKLPFTDVQIVGTPSDKWGEEAVCLIETDRILDNNIRTIILTKIKKSVTDVRYTPHDIICVKKIARTPNGKKIYKNDR